MSAAAIVAAAGASKRFLSLHSDVIQRQESFEPAGSDDLPKQFRSLGGKALVCWSVDVLRAICDAVIVVAPRAHLERAHSLLGDDVVVVAGGPTRQVSVANGLSAVDADKVLVHDAARPFVTKEIVTAVLAAVADADAAIAALPISDTLKQVADGRVERTVDRATLWAAQTPQAFWTDRLRAAHERAALDKIDLTDDAALIERDGGTVVIVEGDVRNIKLTTAADFALAESIAEASR